MSFNSDRTNFSQNTLTDCIKKDLISINKKIQEIGSDLKRKYVHENWITNDTHINKCLDNNYMIYVSKDYIYRDKITVSIDNDIVCYELFGKKTYKTIIPTETVSTNLLNSSDKSKKDIPCHNISDRNQSSTLDKSNNLHYKNSDDTKEGVNKTNIPKKKKELFYMLPLKSSYKWHFTTILPSLIEELNRLNIDSNPNIISCCLRPIFELCVFELKNNINNYLNFDNRKVIKSVINILNDNNAKNEIASSTGFSYKDLKNIIKENEFTKSYEQSNLSAHKASQFLSKGEIENIIKYASFFMTFTNELLGNENLRKLIDGEK